MRTEQIKKYLAEGIFAVSPEYLQSIVDIVNSGEIAKEVIDDIAEGHSYENRDGVAIITVDGATTKKNTWMNAMCGSMIGYDTIAAYIDRANSDDEVHTLLFDIDTVGGDVSGVDELAEIIRSTQKRTVTFYNNTGASAGIWWGTASDEVYAGKTAQLGSIGVMAGYYEPREDDKKVVLVSSNAQNKNCLLNGDCKDKFQARIDHVESIFLERVSRNTGLSQEEIVTQFNRGETIPADKALEINFIDGITTLDALTKTLATMPSSDRKNSNSTKRTSMKLDEALAALATAEASIEAKKVEIDGKDKEIGELVAQVAQLKEEIEAGKASVDAAIEAKTEIFEHAIATGMKMNVSNEAIIEAAKANSKEGADSVILNAIGSQGASFTPQGGEEETDSGIAAYAKQHEGSIR